MREAAHDPEASVLEASLRVVAASTASNCPIAFDGELVVR
jgi:hypothetical protein